MFEKYSDSFLNNFNFDSLIDKFSGKKFISFRKNEIIFSENSMVNEVFFILSGEVNLVRRNSFSEYDLLTVSQSGDILGFYDALTNCVHSHTAVAVKDTNVFAVDRSDMMRLINRKDDFNFWALKYLSKRIVCHD